MMQTSRISPLLILAALFCVAVPWPGAALAQKIEISLPGLEGEERDNVLAFLEIRRLAGREDASEFLIRMKHRRAPANIRNALRPFGYYAVEVQSTLVRDGDVWRATYAVEPGERVLMREVDVSVSGPGARDPVFTELIRREAPVAGTGLRHDRYDGLKSRLQSLAVERGYFEAGFSASTLAVYAEELAADIQLSLDTGPRYRLGEIVIEQNALRDELVQRYLDFDAGDEFSSSALLDAQYALYDSDYFSFVEVATGEPDKERQSVPVSVRADAGNRHRYTAGIGYGTDTEARVSAGWENKRVNRRGHKLLLETKLASNKQELGGRYIFPLARPARERLSVTGNVFREDLADTKSRRIELGLSHSMLRNAWEHERYVRVLREETEIGGLSERATLLLPGAIWLRSKGDDPIYPRRGSRVSLEARGSHSALGSDVDFVQLRLQGRLIRPVGKRMRLLTRAEIGATEVDNTSLLPASLRFYAGGDRSVRGFEFNSLGPRDEAGLVTGGRYLLTASAELEYFFSERWGVAAFADAGNALENFDDDLEYAAGLGIRWRSPVGMFRLDVAKPLSVSGASPRLHISLGPEL